MEKDRVNARHEKAQIHRAFSLSVTLCLSTYHKWRTEPESCASASSATFASEALLNQQSFLLSIPEGYERLTRSYIGYAEQRETRVSLLESST